MNHCQESSVVIQARIDYDEWCRENASGNLEEFINAQKLDPEVATQLRLDISRERGVLAGTQRDVVPQKSTAFRSGQVVNNYRLKRQLGQGGMGTVWMAEQTHPVERVVAIKFMKNGIQDPSFLMRFESECQALALMSHPNVSRVWNVERTEDDQPYLVMEYVDGMPIDEFCTAKRLSIHDRLKLFIQVCNAIQHAHRNGLIHRDIKPSNILVTTVDGQPFAKVIDFGLAVTDQINAHVRMPSNVTDQQVVGSPMWMSPEQAQTLDNPRTYVVDTRTDIYSLGAVLYLLLTDVPPRSVGVDRSYSAAEFLSLLHLENPVAPSLRVQEQQSLPVPFTAGNELGNQLNSSRWKELDSIVEQALRIQPDQRYESVSALTQDIVRFQELQPVHAMPDSNIYRIRRYLRRHKLLCSSAALIVATLIAGTVFSILLANWALKERSIARHRAKLVTNANRLAESEIANQKMVIDLFLAGLRLPSPTTVGATAEMSVHQAVLQIVDRMEDDRSAFVGFPETEATVRKVVGNFLFAIGDYGRAEPQFQAANQLYRTVKGPNDHYTFATLDLVAECQRKQGKFEEAIPKFQQALSLRHQVQGTSHPGAILTSMRLALAYAETGRIKEAIELGQMNHDRFLKHSGPENKHYIATLCHLAEIYIKGDRIDDAKRVGLALEMELEKRQDHLPVDRVNAFACLSEIWHLVGNLSRSLECAEIAFELAQHKFSLRHPFTELVGYRLVDILHQNQQYDRATELARQLADSTARRYGPNHLSALQGSTLRATASAASILSSPSGAFHDTVSTPGIVNRELRDYKLENARRTLENLKARINLLLGKIDLRQNRFAAAIESTLLAQTHFHSQRSCRDQLADCSRVLMNAHSQLGDHDSAIQLGEEALRLHRSCNEVPNGDTVAILTDLKNCNFHAGRIESSLKVATQTLEARKSIHRTVNAPIQNELSSMRKLYWKSERPEQWLAFYKNHLQETTARLGELHQLSIYERKNVAIEHAILNDNLTANSELEHVLRNCRTAFGDTHYYTMVYSGYYQNQLVRTLELDKAEAAILKWMNDAEKCRSFRQIKWQSWSRISLADCLAKQGQYAAAAQWIAEAEKLAGARKVHEFKAANREMVRAASIKALCLAGQKSSPEFTDPTESPIKLAIKAFTQLQSMEQLSVCPYFHWYLPDAARRVAKTYKLTGNTAMASRWNQKAKQLEQQFKDKLGELVIQ